MMDVALEEAAYIEYLEAPLGQGRTERSAPEPSSLIGPETLFLLLSTPFLLFPSVYVPVTILSLLAIPLMLIWQWRVSGRPFPPTPLNFPLLLWSIALGVSILVTADPDLTLPKATGLILGFLIWRYLVLFIHTPQRLRLSLVGFAGLGVLIALIGTFSAAWQFKVDFVQAAFQRLPPRLLSLPGILTEGVHTNQLAGAIVPFVPLLGAVYLAWQQRSRPLTGRRSLSLLGLLLLLGSTAVLLLLTQSRSAWVGAAAGLAVLLAGHSHFTWAQNYRWLLPLSLLVLLLLAGWGVMWIGTGSFDSAALPETTVIGSLQALNFRSEVWHWGLVAVGDFAFTGCGLGAFRRVAPRFYPLAMPANYDISHAHNIFLQVALDLGLPGLVAYLAMLGVVGVIGWQVANNNKDLRPLALGLLSGLVALHVYGLTDAIAPGAKPGLIFWLMLGFLTLLSQWQYGAVKSRSQGGV